ncbi:uncharacterized protein LOC126886121 [Diabrotica virgifera virgifera]|uniref:MADF domain-containing protein n=1 Tax=Diabrotica virgifera virgifera TaxID=50390 RepID=A0ABM5KFI6_DIAVI|nr:uncharacterized protein LOC126886121 [Diabrotica virgifera virgifera]
MEWSNEKCIEFVEDYRQFTCLWKASDKDYKDRIKRGDAQQYLVDKYKLGTRKAVNNKIKSFRSYFHRLHAEYKRKRSGDGRDDALPEPNWFLYKYLLFILDGEENRSGKETFTTQRETSSEKEHCEEDESQQDRDSHRESDFQSGLIFDSPPGTPVIRKAENNDIIRKQGPSKRLKSTKPFEDTHRINLQRKLSHY